MTETQHRFLKAIAERITSGHVAEVRLYPTVRVAQVESGVAIVAIEGDGGRVTGEDEPTSDFAPAAPDVAIESPSDPPAEAWTEDSAITLHPSPSQVHSRLSILTAHFRLTVKGPERGTWEFAMVHDADAPIETVESVVRGVARRAGEDGEPELLSGEAFQRTISEPWWTTTS